MLRFQFLSFKFNLKELLITFLRIALFLAFLIVIFIKLLINDVFFTRTFNFSSSLPPLLTLISLNFILHSIFYIFLIIISLLIFYEIYYYVLEHYVSKVVFSNAFTILQNNSYDDQKNIYLKAFSKQIALIYLLLLSLFLILSVLPLILTYSLNSFVIKLFQPDSGSQSTSVIKVFLFGDFIIGMLFFETIIRPFYLALRRNFSKINDNYNPTLHNNSNLEVKLQVFPFKNSLKNYICLFSLFLIAPNTKENRISKVILLKKGFPNDILKEISLILEKEELDVFFIHPISKIKVKVDSNILAMYLKEDGLINPVALPRQFLQILENEKIELTIPKDSNIEKLEATDKTIARNFHEWLTKRAMHRILPLLILEPMFLFLLHIYLGTFKNIILLVLIFLLIIPIILLSSYAIKSFPFDPDFPIESSCNYISNGKLSNFKYKKKIIFKNEIYTLLGFSFYGIIISLLLLAIPFPDFNLSTHMDKVNQIHVINSVPVAVVFFLIIILFFLSLLLSFMFILIFMNGRSFGYFIWTIMIVIYQYGGLSFSFAFFDILTITDPLIQMIAISPVFIGSLSLLLLFRMEEILVGKVKTTLEWQRKTSTKLKL